MVLIRFFKGYSLSLHFKSKGYPYRIMLLDSTYDFYVYVKFASIKKKGASITPLFKKCFSSIYAFSHHHLSFYNEYAKHTWIVWLLSQPCNLLEHLLALGIFLWQGGKGGNTELFVLPKHIKIF